MSTIPQSLQHILWSKDVATLDIKKDAPYIIHQVLSHGMIDHIQWLFSVYSKEEIRKIFITYPYKDYRASRFSFITRFFLNISDQSLDYRLYVANTPRAIRYQ